MRKSSKALWIALIVVALVCVMALGAMASVESTAVIYGETVNVSDKTADETFDIVFKFKENNTKIECGKITLTWDESKMTATAANKAGVLADAEFDSNIEEAGKAVIAWAGSDTSAEAGDLFKVTFKKTAAFGSDDVAAVDVKVNSLGSVNLFVKTDYADDVTANKAYASTLGENPVWNGEGSAVDFLSAAIADANDGTAVNITLAADMVFESYTDAEEKVVKVLTVKGTEALAENAGMITINSTMTEGAPNYGILVGTSTKVNLYGNFTLDNIKFMPKVESDKGRTAGGVLQFVEGVGIVGNAENNGNVVTPAKGDNNIHLAGHVKVYTGNYHTIIGSYYGSEVTVDSPNLYVAGNTTASYIVAGSGDGNPVSGQSTLYIGGDTIASTVVGGAWYGNGEYMFGGTTTIDGGTITIVAAANAGASVLDIEKMGLYTLTITGMQLMQIRWNF